MIDWDDALKIWEFCTGNVQNDHSNLFAESDQWLIS